ncbi:MAG: galactokinase [Candidatus Latescibacteria bacterium]|jgi:N-acetylgalactosamine kinase|nr:galactokinase [Candidatus Latescibacterota bacterium]
MYQSRTDNEIIKDFVGCFKTQPTVLIKAPGRVNLIGEHTDYNGFPVLPVSIPFVITVAASPRPDKNIHINNSNTQYKSKSFELSQNIPHSPTGEWSNYVKAAASALASHPDFKLHGMNAFFNGDIPASAGLSSSSALVIASALSILATNSRKMDFLELAEMMAFGEHYVGTQGGGMDQAICLFGKEGYAVKINFFPLRCSYVKFPENHSIVVAHSLVRAAKTEDALFLYNLRPAECRLATALINAIYNPEPQLNRLGNLIDYDFFKSYNNHEQFIDNTFLQKSYFLSDIAQILGNSAESVVQKYLLTRDGVPMPVPKDGFKIPQRTLHVLTEADRVEKSCKVLEKNDSTAFGKLMNASHNSCDEDYSISTPELNELVKIMRASGAPGARLTGAGFGGCAIGLVRDNDVKKVIDSVRKLYYNIYIANKRPELLGTSDSHSKLVFSVKPARGALIKQL